MKVPLAVAHKLAAAAGKGGIQVSTQYDITGPMLLPHYAGYIPEDRLDESPTFTVWNAIIGRDFGADSSMRLFLAVDNILDEVQEDLDQGPLRDVTYFYGPLYGRRIRAGFRAKF